MSNSSKFEKSRRFPRRKIEARAALEHLGRLSFQTAVEVSEGGVLLQMKQPLPLKSQVQLSFYLPQGSFISTWGEIIYLLEPTGGHYSVGCRFMDVPDDIQENIRQYVNQG